MYGKNILPRAAFQNNMATSSRHQHAMCPNVTLLVYTPVSLAKSYQSTFRCCTAGQVIAYSWLSSSRTLLHHNKLLLLHCTTHNILTDRAISVIFYYYQSTTCSRSMGKIWQNLWVSCHRVPGGQIPIGITTHRRREVERQFRALSHLHTPVSAASGTTLTHTPAQIAFFDRPSGSRNCRTDPVQRKDPPEHPVRPRAGQFRYLSKDGPGGNRFRALCTVFKHFWHTKYTFCTDTLGTRQDRGHRATSNRQTGRNGSFSGLDEDQ